MTIYKFEWLAIQKSLITWCAILVGTYYFLIAGIYPMFTDGMKIVDELLAYMPADYLLVLGLDVNHMSGYSGFYSFAYIYIALIAGLRATSVTLKVFGREKQAHSQEFLFAKPVSRAYIFKSKLRAILTALLLFNLIVIVISFFCFNKYGELDRQAILATLAITFSQLIFVGIAIAIAVFIPKIRTTTTITATIGLVTFTIEVFINALRIRTLAFFSPLHFFTPKSVFESGGYDTYLGIYAVSLLIIMISISARHFVRADITKL